MLSLPCPEEESPTAISSSLTPPEDGTGVKTYTELVSPFIQTKALAHCDRIAGILAGKIPPPVTCEIDLADGFCNQACPHCFFGTQYKKNPTFLDTDALKGVLAELGEAGVRAVEFVGGGEPTTHKDAAQIIVYAADQGLDVGLVTNGQLLHRVLPAAHALTYVRVSLDAACQDTYRKTHHSSMFAKVIANIEQAVSVMRPDAIGCGFLIVPDNVCDIIDAAKLVKSIGARFIQYRPATLSYPVDPRVWKEAHTRVRTAVAAYADDTFQVFDAGVKWRHTSQQRQFPRCLTTPLVAVLKASGDLALCILKRNETATHIGNIYQGGFFAHWGNERHRRLIEQINLGTCPKPCKHDSYNIMAEAMKQELLHINFL